MYTLDIRYMNDLIIRYSIDMVYISSYLINNYSPSTIYEWVTSNNYVPGGPRLMWTSTHRNTQV